MNYHGSKGKKKGARLEGYYSDLSSKRRREEKRRKSGNAERSMKRQKKNWPRHTSFLTIKSPSKRNRGKREERKRER